MWDQDVLKAALDFAARAHGTQQVPGSGFPYVVHVTKVATEVLAACTADPATDATLAVTVALLHDTIEDCSITREELERTFGARVAEGVVAVSKDDALPKADRMADSLRRIAQQPREVAMVKLADRITNLEPPPANWTREKRLAYLAEARVIHSSLAQASAHLAARLERKMEAYAAWCV